MSIKNLGFRDLQYLVAIAENGSFGKAAAACGISQPALSERVKRIEYTLGACLFERSKRGLTITAIGEPVIYKARELLDEAIEIDQIVAAGGQPLVGTLRVGAIATLGPYLFPLVLPQLRRRYPKLELILHEGLTDVLLARLMAGALDVVLAAAPLQLPGVSEINLFREPLVLATPIDHPFAALQAVNPTALCGDDMVLLEDGHCLSGHALDVCPGARGRKRERLHAMSLETLRHMVAAGSGYTLLPVLAVGEHPPLNDLVSYVPLDEEQRYGRVITMAYRKSYSRVDELKLLADVIRQSLPSGQGISLL
ncbi:MAG: hydrogen peroxide-inducible genes activator [Halioglobus sp.]